MTTSDDAPVAAPFPDHVISGDVPDPVVASAPQAAAPEDDGEPDTGLLSDDDLPNVPPGVALRAPGVQ
jgi:hypothetical protein